MNEHRLRAQGGNFPLIRWLTCLMFLMFAMTSDAVGSVIPRLIAEFHLSMKMAGAFHYVPMAAIALGALLLGFLADRLGRKRTIVIGLIFYAVGSGLFAVGGSFSYFVGLLALSGLGISIFKIGALALIGDISKSTSDHTSLMNAVEGFFGVGSIAGPALVALFISLGASWRWLYVIAAAICGLLIAAALVVRYPQPRKSARTQMSLRQTISLARSPYALAFSLLIMLYTAVEVSIYVWMPTYLRSYDGPLAWMATYALTIFFVLRAIGRFLGAWILHYIAWTRVLALFGIAIFACFAGSIAFGIGFAVFSLPLSGLFMSTMYPTLNSKGISCFTKSQHGAIAGIILFFTASAAALGPLGMAVVSDAFGAPIFGFGLATMLSALLAVGLIVNLLRDPTHGRLAELERIDYTTSDPGPSGRGDFEARSERQVARRSPDV